MAVWAYECRPCAGKGVWFVSRATVMEMPADVRLLRLKVGTEWRCAVVDRSRVVEVDDMLIADLRPRFGNVAVVLMGQDDDGSPHYHGNSALAALLADVPIDKMPWKTYPMR